MNLHCLESQLGLPLRDYRPYEPGQLRFTDQVARNFRQPELERMDTTVESILSGMTLREYISARGGLESHGKIIRSSLARIGLPIRGRILEFGAGTCKLSAHLSQFPDSSEIFCMDFSRDLLLEIAPRVISLYGGDLSKVSFIRGNMNDVDVFPEQLDLVVCYGAVHHLMLGEHFFHHILSKLKPGGNILCLHEPTLPRITLPTTTYKAQREKLIGSRKDGANENQYAIWRYREMVGSGFDFHFIRHNRFNGWKKYAFRLLGDTLWDEIFMIDFWGTKL